MLALRWAAATAWMLSWFTGSGAKFAAEKGLSTGSEVSGTRGDVAKVGVLWLLVLP